MNYIKQHLKKIILLIICLSLAVGFLIYKNYKDKWIIRNYVDASGMQGMFYTLYNEYEDKLICVDSGCYENNVQVRTVVNNYGGHVDAWFLTHYDNDHIDSFNSIYGTLQGITIDKIYVTPMNYDKYYEQLRWWDTPASYETFLSQTKEDDAVTKLNTGDTFTVCGLDCQVFSAYDDFIEQMNDDLPNTASLVFKLSGKKQSILFTGDARTDALSEHIINTYGTQLQATYVQLGHHGNNSFPTSLYDVVNPEVAIFDAPDWVMDGDEYTAKQLKQYFIDKGIETSQFSSSNHEWELR